LVDGEGKKALRLIVWESEFDWLPKMKCAACGGEAAAKDKKFDAHIRKKLGCGRSDKVHEFPILGGQETIKVEGCPHQLTGTCDMNLYKRAANWAENGRLHYLYPPDGLPNKVAEALDIFESETDKKQRYLMKQATKKNKGGE
jgi:hypothetical protein